MIAGITKTPNGNYLYKSVLIKTQEQQTSIGWANKYTVGKGNKNHGKTFSTLKEVCSAIDNSK
tara:strand:- start:24 stop:212 length:189 start_codon:yes stop_codon:yes gene_type:complete